MPPDVDTRNAAMWTPTQDEQRTEHGRVLDADRLAHVQRRQTVGLRRVRCLTLPQVRYDSTRWSYACPVRLLVVQMNMHVIHHDLRRIGHKTLRITQTVFTTFF